MIDTAGAVQCALDDVGGAGGVGGAARAGGGDRGDLDGDGLDDEEDNCPSVANPALSDQDGDGVSDVCDPDLDEDGVDNDLDKCPNSANADQLDADGDQLGDVCEIDDQEPEATPPNTAAGSTEEGRAAPDRGSDLWWLLAPLVMIAPSARRRIKSRSATCYECLKVDVVAETTFRRSFSPTRLWCAGAIARD